MTGVNLTTHNKSLDASGGSVFLNYLGTAHGDLVRAAASTPRYASFFMTIVKQILGHHVTFGGEPHSGWLPHGSTTPRPTLARAVALNIMIEFDGSGYLLCYASDDRALANDTWHQTLADAEQAAVENFGVRSDQWKTLA